MSIKKTKLTKNYFLAQLTWQAQCPQLTHVEPAGSTAAWGHRVEVRKGGFPMTLTLVQPGTSELMERWIRGGVHGLLLLSVLCQHSCSCGLVLNQSLFLSPAVLSFRLIRAAQGLSSWLCPGCGNICTNTALRRTSGKEWRWRDVRGESRDLLLGVGMQPCT